MYFVWLGNNDISALDRIDLVLYGKRNVALQINVYLAGTVYVVVVVRWITHLIEGKII
jgi:hypothetical protein